MCAELAGDFHLGEDYMHDHVPNTDNRPLKFIENFLI